MITALCISLAINTLFIGGLIWLLFSGDGPEEEIDLYADPGCRSWAGK
jgi:hypothetical protein